MKTNNASDVPKATNLTEIWGDFEVARQLALFVPNKIEVIREDEDEWEEWDRHIIFITTAFPCASKFGGNQNRYWYPTETVIVVVVALIFRDLMK